MLLLLHAKPLEGFHVLLPELMALSPGGGGSTLCERRAATRGSFLGPGLVWLFSDLGHFAFSCLLSESGEEECLPPLMELGWTGRMAVSGLVPGLPQALPPVAMQRWKGRPLRGEFFVAGVHADRVGSGGTLGEAMCLGGTSLSLTTPQDSLWPVTLI